MSDDEMREHMRTAHGYPEPDLWRADKLAELHSMEHQLINLGSIDFTSDMEVHGHAS